MTTKTDLDGRFVLSYAGVGELEYVSVEGGERVQHVRSGSDITLFKG